MKTRSEKMKFSVLTLAVQGALALMYATPMMAHAEDDEVAALTRPKSFVEAGGAYVSDKSAKFGEYNGLNDSGGYFIGNFGIRGGDAYDSYDGGNGTTRWEINGNDLGTTSRSVGGAVSNQGKWNLKFDYDELRHNISDTYQTPLQGSMGGNNFTLPSNFGAINAATGANSTRVMNATQLGAMHQEDIYTTRHNTSFGAGYNFNDQWSVKLDYNHLDQSGSKLIAGGTQGGISLFRGNVATSTGRAEAVNILMNPTNYTTDTMEAAVNWVGEKGFFTGGYFGSIFRDGYNSLTWQSSQATGPTTCQGNGCFVTNTMSTAPDNSFHQLNLKGGYYFTSATKLVGGLSYGRGTQDDSYAGGVMQAGGLPRSSLNGEVITTHADMKLTNQTTKDLMLSAGFRFNERDNKTDSNIYKYVQIGNSNYTGVNTPYSNKKTQFDLAADYRITKGQTLRLSYEHEDIKRWCNSNATPGAECVANTASGENKYGLMYRLSASDSVKLNAGYAYADRKTDLNHTYLTPIGPTPQAGINGGDVVGFVAFPYASRTQNILKGGVNWGITERFDVGLSGRYSYDNYDETLGMQSGRSESVNLDATYSFSEQSSLSVYATWQQAKRNLKNGANGTATTVPTQIWDNQLNQRDMTVGVNTKHTGFFGGKLDLLGDLSYSNANSSYVTQISYLPTANTCGAATSLTCGETPDITAKLLSFKISGAYSIDKHSKIGLLYLYQNLKSNDYYYNTYQYGYTPNRVMPTNEQSPNYSINVLAATYMYTF